MSFPPCRFRPAASVSHTQMAPGVSSLSTTNGDRKLLSHSQSRMCFHPEGLQSGRQTAGEETIPEQGYRFPETRGYVKN